MKDFFPQQMDFVYFIYGLSFLLLAITSFFVHRVNARLGFWKWIAFFGLIHCCAEWMDMLTLSIASGPIFDISKLIVTTSSFLCFAEIVRQYFQRNHWPWLKSWILVPVILCVAWLGYSLDGIRGTHVLSRYVFGGLGGIAASWIVYCVVVPKGVTYCPRRFFAIVFALYAATHFIAPPSTIPWLCKINQNMFLDWAGFPIQLVRMTLAVLAAFLLWQYYTMERILVRNQFSKPYRFKHDYFLPLGLFLTVTLGWLLTDSVSRQMDIIKKNESVLIARLEASNLADWNNQMIGLTGVGLKDLTVTSKDLETSLYAQLKQYFNGIILHYPKMASFYLFGDKNNQTVFMVGTENPHRKKLIDLEAIPGEVYAQDRPILSAIFKDGVREIVDPGLKGDFINIYVPVIDYRTNKIIAVLGNDYDVKEWHRDLARYRLIVILTIFLFALMMIIFFVIYKHEHESKRDIEEHQHELMQVSVLLGKERQNLESMFNTTQIGFLWLDDALRVRRMNSVVASSFGRGEGLFVVGKQGERCVIETLEKMASEVLLSGKSVNRVEFQYPISSSEVDGVLWLEVGADILDLEGGRSVLFSLLDITERKRVEHELEMHRTSLEDIVRRRTEDMEKAKARAEEANRLKTQFLFNVSHEIRTPLNGIVGFSELIAKSQNLERIHVMAKTLLNEADILLALVNDVLDQGKLEEGKLAIFYAPIDLRQIISDVVKTVTIPANEKGLELRVRFEEDVPQYVFADRLRLCQVLLNLLNNAIKFTDEGSVTIEVKSLGDNDGKARVRFAVIDTGVGIPEDKQHLIFERFAQVDGASTRAYGGAGLGTSIAKELVKLMGGTLGFSSQVGLGTIFWCAISFSVATAEDLAVADGDEDKRKEDIPAVVSTGRILVVEDYEINQDVVRAHLENGGYQSDFVSDGYAAIKACMAQEYRLILMDIQMPGIDGYETTRRIRALGGWSAAVPIVGVTANADDKTRDTCFKLGMQDVMTKPIRRKPFLAMIARWMFTKQEASSEAGAVVEENDGQVFDYARAIEEFGGDQALVNTVLDKFFEQVRAQLPVIEKAVKENDGETIGSQAHKIKGGAANLTAMKLAACAKTMEEKGKAKDLGGVENLLEMLKQEIVKLQHAVDQARAATKKEGV